MFEFDVDGALRGTRSLKAEYTARCRCMRSTCKIACFLTILMVGLCFGCKHNEETNLVDFYDSEIIKLFDSSKASTSYLKLLDKYRSEHGPVLCISSLGAKSFVDSSLVTGNKYWVLRKGTVMDNMGDNPKSKTYVSYSADYLDWLDRYSSSTEGEWVRSYYRGYQTIGDISPSMIVDFDKQIRLQNLKRHDIKKVFLVHYLTIGYNYCSQ